MSKLSLLVRIATVLAPFFAPWWLVVIFALAALFFFDSYYEIIIIGVLCDIFYFSEGTFFGMYGFTLISCVLFLLVQQIKKRLILY